VAPTLDFGFGPGPASLCASAVPGDLDFLAPPFSMSAVKSHNRDIPIALPHAGVQLPLVSTHDDEYALGGSAHGCVSRPLEYTL
jgi:hypothetical protein